MSDQLEDLKRQRALVAEHLAWLDRLIAEEAQKRETPTVTGDLPSSPSGLRRGDTASGHAEAGGEGGRAPSMPESEPNAPGGHVPPQIAEAAASAGGSDTEALFARFTADERPALQPPSKFGCWLGFSLLLLAGVGAVIAIIYGTYR